MTKIAEAEPFFCAACHGRPEGARYVDFEAHYDGPVINSEDGIKQTIDDLVLCEECVAAAARLVGFIEASGDKTAVENKELKAQLATQAKVVASQARALESMRKALDSATGVTLAA